MNSYRELPCIYLGREYKQGITCCCNSSTTITALTGELEKLTLCFYSALGFGNLQYTRPTEVTTVVYPKHCKTKLQAVTVLSDQLRLRFASSAEV